MAVSYERAVDGAPGIDEEVTGGAVKAVGGFSQHVSLRTWFTHDDHNDYHDHEEPNYVVIVVDRRRRI